MPAPPDLIEEDLAPWQRALDSQFDIEDALVTGDYTEVRAAGGRFSHSKLDRVNLMSSRLRSLTLTDVVAETIEASGADWTGARLRRVHFAGGRLSGLQLLDAELDDVVFQGCQMRLATFHSSTLRNVRFEGCVLDEAFLGHGRMQAVRFDDCSLVRADFTGARLARVDLRGSALDPAGEVGGLRGATIDVVQLMDLAPLLARSAGLKLEDS